jgi:3-carboxy-cis,cis-muconate cycloisomerase
VTFGYKMAGLLSAVLRHRERIAQLRERVLVGEFAGAAGTLASLETGAMETQAGLCAELGLAPAGDRLAHHPRQHRRGRHGARA